MGGSYRQFSARGKWSLGWLAPEQVTLAATSADFLLDQGELPSPGGKVLQIPIGIDDEGNDSYYWIEYRKGLGTFGGTRDGDDVVQVRTHRSYTWYPQSSRYLPSSNGVRLRGLVLGGSITGRVFRATGGPPLL